MKISLVNKILILLLVLVLVYPIILWLITNNPWALIHYMIAIPASVVLVIVIIIYNVIKWLAKRRG